MVNLSADSTRMLVGNQCAIRVSASAPEGDQLTLSYAVIGGSISSSGPTATTATFTGSQLGSDSTIVTALDGHGGATRAVALVYVLRAGAPDLFGIKFTRSWRGVPEESLVVLSGEAGGSDDWHDISANGDRLPGLLGPGMTQTLESVDPCAVTLSPWRVRVQRPMPDGRISNTTPR